MGISESELVAIRIQLREVQRLRSDLAGVKDSLRQVGEAGRTATAQSVANSARMARGHQDVAKSAIQSGRAQREALDSVNRQASQLKSTLLGVASAYIGVAGIKKLGSDALEAAFEKRQFDAVTKAFLGAGGSKQLDTRIQAMSGKYGADLGALRDAGKGLTASPMGNQGAKAIGDALEAFSLLGSTSKPEDVAEALRQFKQMSGVGRVLGQDLKVMSERVQLISKALLDAGLSEGKILQMNQSGESISFDQFKDILLNYSKRPEMRQIAGEMAGSPQAEWQRSLNQLRTEVLEPLGNELGPELVKMGKEVLPSVTDGLKVFGHLMVWTVENWKPVTVAVVAGFVGVKVANVALAASAWRAASALNGVAGAGGVRAIGGGAGQGASWLARMGGAAKGALGTAGTAAGTGATTFANSGGTGVAALWSAQSGAGAAGSAGTGILGALTAPVTATAGSIAAAALAVPATAAAAFYLTTQLLNMGSKKSGKGDNFSDALARDFARSKGARVDSEGNESYGPTDKRAMAMFDRNGDNKNARARAAWVERQAKRKAYADAGLDPDYAEGLARDAAKKHNNAARPANRTTIMHRVANEQAHAVRAAT